MRTAKDIEELIRNRSFRAGPDLHRRTIDDALDAQDRSKRAALAEHRPNVWRIIMKSNTRKLAAAVFVVALSVGVYELGGPRAAFARTTRVVRTSLAGLREFAWNLRERKPEKHMYESDLPPARQSSGTLCTIISARVQEYSLVGARGDLPDFLETEDIEFLPAGDSLNASYAVLDSDRVERFADFAGADESLTLRSSPSLMLREGHEGTLGIVGAEDQDVVALSLLATVQDEGERIVLSFSFLRGHDGFELPSLDIKIGDAILFRFDPAARAGNTEDETLVLVRIKVQSPG